jgi:hypothetical protein
VQLYRYFTSQSSEFCRHNPLCCFSTSNTEGKRIFRYGLGPETFGYTPYIFWCLQCPANSLAADFKKLQCPLCAPSDQKLLLMNPQSDSLSTFNTFAATIRAATALVTQDPSLSVNGAFIDYPNYCFFLS